ncbi:hypothetical protein WISP_115642 [Willisornis vidua]|uniref:Uncharacterized protein n=1 Tax=Willisornis vidua TaxID=1566151 RepID=A0ABQ9CZZ0_9PASS|nr:hypothetical protein WISP_115642 [Willisornis vidua]
MLCLMPPRSLTTHGHISDSKYVAHTTGSPSWANEPYWILDDYARGTDYEAGSEPEESSGQALLGKVTI